VENAKKKEEEELRRICIKYKINNPIIGEDHYDSDLPDSTKVQKKFNQTIIKACFDDNMF